MGIRFACNLCEHPLNIKRDLAGKIGVCPRCGGKIRIPLDDAPKSPLDEPDALWHVRPPAGGQYGPASGAVLRTWIAENRVTGSTLIWREGWSQWRSARETLPELAETTRRPASIDHNVDANDLLDDPLLSNASVAVEPSGTPLIGAAAIGQQRGNRNQRRMMLVVVLAVISVFLILTLVILATRS